MKKEIERTPMKGHLPACYKNELYSACQCCDVCLLSPMCYNSARMGKDLRSRGIIPKLEA